MALFKSSEDKVAKQMEKERAALAKFGLQNLKNPEDAASAKRIAQELLGSNLMETGMKMSLAKPEVQLPISLQRAIMEQNFIIIRQLDRIAALLEKE